VPGSFIGFAARPENNGSQWFSKTSAGNVDASTSFSGTAGRIDAMKPGPDTFHPGVSASFIHPDRADETGSRAGECRRRGCETSQYARSTMATAIGDQFLVGTEAEIAGSFQAGDVILSVRLGTVAFL
jgi:hypothetical protein